MNRCIPRFGRHAVSVLSFSDMRPPPLLPALSQAFTAGQAGPR